MSLTVLLVDDQRLFASSLKRVLESADAIERVDVAADGRAALEYVAEHVPDIILMDTHMPRLDGLQATRKIKAEHPDVTILMLSAFGYDDYVREAMAAGASGYLLKDVSPEELVSSMFSAVGGAVIMSPQVVPDLSQEREFRPRPRAAHWISGLTPKERRILLLISTGHGNAEIADRMNLGSQTVRNYVSTIYSKIGARDRFEAMRMAIEANIQAFVHDESEG